MKIDLEEIRTELSQVDGLSGVIIEHIHDNDLEDDETLEELKEILEKVQDLVTQVQENQNWI